MANRSLQASRTALSVLLAVALVPLPTLAGPSTEVASAAPGVTPLYAISAFPTNPTSVWSPSSIALAPDGDVIVADTMNGRIRVLSSTGALKASIGTFGSTLGRLREPKAVALGPDNRIYVADTKNHRIQVFERNGAFVRSWGSFGSALGQMKFPLGIAVDTSGTVYVSDSENDRVQTFTATGVSLAAWGSEGPNPNQFSSPAGIAVDAARNVYVVDSMKNYVKKFGPGPAYTHIANFGYVSGDSGPMRYWFPTGISVTADGTGLIIADTGNSRIERCTLSGTVLEAFGSQPGSLQVGLFLKPGGAAVAQDGTWVIADTDAQRIQRRTPAGAWLAPWSTPSTATPYTSAPEAVTADPNTGVTFVADTGNSRILKYDASGTFLGSIAETGSGPGQVSSPKGLLALHDGQLLVSDTGNNRIQIYDASGAYQSSFGTGELSGPRSLAINSLDTVFVADTGNHRVAKYAPGGGTWSYQSMIGTAGAGNGPGEFNAPRGVSVDGAYLYVADTGNNRVQKFNAASGTLAVASATRAADNSLLAQPASVLATSTGIVVTDTLNRRLVHYDQLLTAVADYDGSDTRVGSMREPASLAAAPGGRMLLLERAGSRVQVLVRDAEPPVTTLTGVPTVPSRDATLTFSAADPGSGVFATYARTDGVTSTVDGPLVLSTDGTHTVSFWSVDYVGNVESEQTTSVVIDRTPPSGTLTLNAGAAFTNSTTVVVASSVEGASAMRFAADVPPTTWVAYAPTGTVTLPDADGAHTVFAEYRDAAGNVRALTGEVTLDRGAPVVVNFDSSTHPVGVPTWGEVALQWDAPADLSGIAGYALSFDQDPSGTPPRSITTTGTTYTFPDVGTGEYYVHIIARDTAGNWGPTVTRAISALSDTLDPVTTATPHQSGATSQTVTISLSATDTISGVDAIHYRRDLGVQQTYTVPIEFADEGTHTLIYWAVDRAGRAETESTLEFIVDRTPAVVTSVSYAQHRFDTHLTVQWPVPSDLSGVVGYAVSITAAAAEAPYAVTTTTPAWRFPRVGTPVRYINVRTLDAAGNWGPTFSAPLKPQPVTLSRPVLTRVAVNPRQTAFVVAGSLSPATATGSVRLVVESSTDGGTTWKRETSKGRSLTLGSEAAYTTRITLARPAPTTTTPKPQPTRWRVRAYYTGNAVLAPGLSPYSAVVIVR